MATLLPAAWLTVVFLAATGGAQLLSVAPELPPSEVGVTVFGGAVRVQALSPRLLRVEPVGPAGFEDRTTFMVSNRSALGPGAPLAKLNESRSEAYLATDHWVVRVLAAGAGQRVCRATQRRRRAQDAVSIDPSVPVDGGGGTAVGSPAACASLCRSNGTACVGWNCQATPTVVHSTCRCHLLSGWSSLVADNTSVHGTCGLQPAFVVSTADGGAVLYDSRAAAGKDTPGTRNLLLWPSPLAQPAYALEDFPRFTVPQWGPTPMPPSAAAGRLNETNGYDFSNNQDGDTYVFLLGTDLGGWHAARQEFNALSGPTPLLPDFAWGTWFTYWNNYSYTEATADVLRWERDRLPLDVWGLDMNWCGNKSSFWS